MVVVSSSVPSPFSPCLALLHVHITLSAGSLGFTLFLVVYNISFTISGGVWN
jgi:hypothetical protein